MGSGRVTILGSGLMGTEIAIDMLGSEATSEVRVLDSSAARLSALRQRVEERYEDGAKRSKLNTQVIDVVGDEAGLKQTLSQSDLGVGALPHGIAERAVRGALEAGVDYIDLIYSWRLDDSAQIDREAIDRGMTLVPACGLAPGLTNILVMHGNEVLGGADEVKIMVGGIPQRPVPPMNYRIVFALESVLEEYTREALVVRDGERKLVPPMTEVEDVYFSQLPGKKFEAFITDGLSTLPSTINARNMAEKTIRWPGHAAQVRFLASIGMLSADEIQVGNTGLRISPLSVLAAVLSERLRMREEDRDMTLLKVSVSHGGDGVVFSMVDMYDSRNRVTSMARTTAYPCSTIALMMLQGKISQKGFVPPESAVRGTLYQVFQERLADKGLHITTESGKA